MKGWDETREMGSMMWRGMAWRWIKGREQRRGGMYHVFMYHISCMMDGERREGKREKRERIRNERERERNSRVRPRT